MNLPPTLTGSHLSTYKMIFQDPTAHNLDWRAVRGLLASLGHILEEPNGSLTVTRNGQVLVAAERTASAMLREALGLDPSEVKRRFGFAAKPPQTLVSAIMRAAKSCGGGSSGGVDHQRHVLWP